MMGGGSEVPQGTCPGDRLSKQPGLWAVWLGQGGEYSGNHMPLSFQVSKKYSEIEEFYQKLSSHYPAASLPPLPRKVLFVGESDIRERRVLFNEILRCVSKDAELAGSPELLEFLGT